MTRPADTPVGTDAVTPIPHGQTAIRLTWRFLPPEVRRLVEEHLGGPVEDAVSQDAGFTPGFASVLTTSEGRRGFVKAASWVAQRDIAESYAEEARKLTALGDEIPAPRLLWVHDDEAWVVLGFEAVEARPPRRPWSADDLGRALDLAEAIVDATHDTPGALALNPMVEDVPGLLTGWDTVPDGWPHRDEAAALATSLASRPADHFVHGDLRDDNVLLAHDGRTLACDWNWPALGPVWQDTVDLLISAHGDGVDVEPTLASRRLTRDADPEHVDSWIAAICGFMLSARRRPTLARSPHLRTHADWYAEAAWSLLAQRRGWS
jgi:aminoglycoside phosphotransferase (APT) family kinase protein